MRWRCKRCVAEAVTRRHQAMRRKLIGEAGGACALCGYDRCIISLEFHHVDATTKLFAMTMSSGKSLAVYRAEATKCVLLCSNCHREVEAGAVASPPAGTKFQTNRSALGREPSRTSKWALSGTTSAPYAPTNATASISTDIRGSISALASTSKWARPTSSAREMSVTYARV